jgi:D-galactose 1-dehydrogenase
LVRAGESEVDVTPFVHVADAFMLGARKVTAPFAW